MNNTYKHKYCILCVMLIKDGNFLHSTVIIHTVCLFHRQEYILQCNSTLTIAAAYCNCTAVVS